MTIEEATLYMELYKRKLFNSVSDLDKDIEAYDTAIDTMRKYQKIEDLVNDCADESVDDTSCCTRYIGLIEEVIYTESERR